MTGTPAVGFLTHYATVEMHIPFFYFALFFRTALVAYGSSKARGGVGAVATATATPDLSHICEPHDSSQQRRILNPGSLTH